ncbi:membrane-bound lytic murein transglycosylase [Bordetella hinzii]|uniref:murein transglycosylase A n=1 Tax=Bordetella hinzii TaxID=103855 RepID=UPI000429C338|nr:MltA domain-containing protein [Bordetella hinzii]AKQ57618.1 Membrane-bound lytic murein transglycosylase A precursor [Bordetella hinzii]KCB28864.1 MltA specific insert domain protein [Bordetella hinzii L60]SNV57711.1 membrane-bound lytic murein transglycosylase [Bordetella hinzii]
MKRLLCLSLLSALLAACSTTTEIPPESGGPGGAPVAEGPLVVPPLSALPDTPARSLAGRYQRAAWNELPGWESDDLSRLWPLVLRNCKGLMRPTSGNLAAPARATPRAWQPVCAAAADPARAPAAGDAAAVRRFMQAYLQPWRLNGADGRPAVNTVTGYYEPLVRGARERSARHQWPLYGVPDDLLTIDLGAVYPDLAGKRVRGKLDGRRVVPYDTRAGIEASDRKPPVVAWVDDPVDNFFLQVQGSGRVLLTEGRDAGKTIRVAYADHNGQPYVSIGRWLIDRGELRADQASMQNIRAWAQRNPARVQEMLNANPAVVFFREEAVADPEQGPKGAYAIPLAPGRSIAVDASFVPLGTPVYLATTYPASERSLQRLVFAQDTGTAIRGAARADYYWGFGDEAGQQAGRMKQRGQMWLLWPKQAGEPSAR